MTSSQNRHMPLKIILSDSLQNRIFTHIIILSVPMKIANVIILLVFLCSLLSVSAATFEQTSAKQVEIISSFLKKALSINVDVVDKFIIKSPDKDDRFHIEIENGNKKMKIVLSKPLNGGDQLKLMFMEQITRVGNQKSFLNIRSSWGNEERENTQRQAEQRRKQQRNSGSEIFNSFQASSEIENLKMEENRRLQTFIFKQFPMANLKNTELLHSSTPDVYNIRVEVDRIWYLVTILKELKKENEQLSISNVIKLSDK